MILTKTKKNTTPLEVVEQAKVVQYIEILQRQGKDITFSAIPNSTFTKSWSVKRRNTSQGVRAGLPDLFLIINKEPFWIEMKRQKGGVISEEQKHWHTKIKESGQEIYVCYGFEEAKTVIDLKLK